MNYSITVKEGETVVEGPRKHYDGMWDYNILVPLNDPLPLITDKEVNVETATVSTKKDKKTRKVTFSSSHNSGNDSKLLFIDANVGAFLEFILIFG